MSATLIDMVLITKPQKWKMAIPFARWQFSCEISERRRKRISRMPGLGPYCLSRFTVCCCYQCRHLWLTVSTGKIVCPDRTEHHKKKNMIALRNNIHNMNPVKCHWNINLWQWFSWCSRQCRIIIPFHNRRVCLRSEKMICGRCMWMPTVWISYSVCVVVLLGIWYNLKLDHSKNLLRYLWNFNFI